MTFSVVFVSPKKIAIFIWTLNVQNDYACNPHVKFVLFLNVMFWTCHSQMLLWILHCSTVATNCAIVDDREMTSSEPLLHFTCKPRSDFILHTMWDRPDSIGIFQGPRLIPDHNFKDMLSDCSQLVCWMYHSGGRMYVGWNSLRL